VRSGVLDSGAVAGMDCVAVVPFENRTGTARAGEVVAESVANTLLTSAHYNILGPDESGRLADLIGAVRPVDWTVAAAQKLGEALGVQGILMGRVSSLEERDLTQRTRAAESMVAFAARLVDTRKGEVVWTAATSHFDYPRALAIARPRDVVMNEAVVATVEDLVDARSGSGSGGGLCARAYASLADRVQATGVASLQAVPSGDRGAGAPTYAPSTGPVAALAGGVDEMPPLPGLPPVSGGLSSQPGAGAGAAPDALPPLAALAGTEPALPALPGGAGDLGALPALPGGAGTSGAGLPALPGDMPALPGDMPALPGDMPALPSLAPGGDALAALPAMPGDGSTAHAASPGKPPKQMLGRLKGASKAMAKKLYAKAPPSFTLEAPQKATTQARLGAKGKQNLDALAGVLRAAPGMRIRIEVKIEVKAAWASAAVLQVFAEKQAALLADYLRTKHGIGPERVSQHAVGRTAAKGSKALANVVVESYGP